jgi:RNA polymerase sigma factor for flagellar operon FliA
MMQAAATCRTVSDNLSHAELWEAYWERGDAAQDALLEAYLPLTRRVLERISIRLPSYVSIKDLSQAALLGLYKSLRSFDPDHQVPFEAYAYPRIRGAVLDELRATDYLSRGRRARVEKVEAVICEWMNEHSDMPSEDEICAKLDMSMEAFHQLMDQAKPWCSLDAEDEENASLYNMVADSQNTSDVTAQEKDVRHLLREAFRQLDMREQKILYLYYFEELRLSEIAALYGLTEARISQIRALSLVRLRAVLGRISADDLTK